MRRLIGVVFCVLGIGCSDSSSTSSTSTTSPRGNFVCIWSRATCLHDLCKGCTTGTYTSCPPPDSAYEEICSPEPTEDACRAKAGPPSKGAAGSTQLTGYSRDVRILRGITCAQYRADGEESTTSVDRICTGICQ